MACFVGRRTASSFSAFAGGGDGTEIYSGGAKVTADGLDPDRTLPVSAANKFDGTIGIANGFLNIF